jgi:heat shock protein HslJ
VNVHRLISTALATTLLVALPGAALAQAEAIESPEGPEWVLTSYYVEEAAELVPVPFPVEPTLLLQDGVASGFAGCNQFSGSYEIDGGSLRFSEEMSVTLALCDDPAQSIEGAYLALLSEVDGWIIDTSALQLTNQFGEVILTYETPSIMWTPSQVSALMTALAELRTSVEELEAGLETLSNDVEALNVPGLRQRITKLQTTDRNVKKRLQALEEASGTGSSSQPSQPATFSSAEKVLLKGIPTRIANFCRPLRSSLPKSTRAAVTCTPNTNAVSTVDYYLMNGADAAAEFGSVMSQFNVPDVAAEDRTCAEGVKSQRVAFGGGWQAEGCFRTAGTAQVRFIDNAADCRKLRVNKKTMPNPAIYMALQGSDLERVYSWATRNVPADSNQLTSITQPIPSNLGTSPSCGV